MRFGWLAAAAAVMCAVPAVAQTDYSVTQDFSFGGEAFGHPAPNTIGGLNLSSKQYIKSVVLNYMGSIQVDRTYTPDYVGKDTFGQIGIYVPATGDDFTQPEYVPITCDDHDCYADFDVQGSLNLTYVNVLAGPVPVEVQADNSLDFNAEFASEHLEGTATFEIGAVPEPATWAMMILGFGIIGFGLRRNRSTVIRSQLVVS